MRRALPVVLLVLAAGCGGKSPSHAAIAFVTPSGATWTNGVVHVELETSKPGVRADLLLDGQPLATGIAFPYRYDWDTTAVAEGSHALQAKVGSVSTLPVTVVVDRTPPTVVSRTPAPGATNVSVHDPVKVVFSEPLDASTVTDASVVLTGDGAVDLGKTLVLTSGTQLAITPAGAYQPGTISAALAGSITDRAGNALPAGGWSWTAPDWYDLGAFSESVFARTIAFYTTGGGFYAANTDASGGFADIEVLQLDAAGAWNLVGQPDEVDPGAGDAFVQQFVADQTGAPVIGFIHHPLAGGIDFYVSRWNGASWQMLGGAPIGTSATGTMGWLDLLVEPSGQLLAAWSDDAGAFEVTEWNGSAWTAITENVAPGGAPYERLHVAWTANVPTVVFEDLSGTTLVRKRFGPDSWATYASYAIGSDSLQYATPVRGSNAVMLTGVGAPFIGSLRVGTPPNDAVGGSLGNVFPAFDDAPPVLGVMGNATVYVGLNRASLNPSSNCQVLRLSDDGASWQPVRGLLGLSPGDACQVTSLDFGPAGRPLVGIEEIVPGGQPTVIHRVVILNE